MKPKGPASAFQDKMPRSSVSFFSQPLPVLWAYCICLHICSAVWPDTQIDISILVWGSELECEKCISGHGLLAGPHGLFSAHPAGPQSWPLALKVIPHSLITDGLWQLILVWEISKLMFSYLGKENHVWILTIGIISWIHVIPQAAGWGCFT